MIFLIILILLLSIPASGSGETVPACTVSVSEYTDFGSIWLEISIDGFNALGFRYGDSCDLVFSNGETLEDVPYYNGYYCRTNAPLIVSYPGYKHPCFAFNSGDPAWEKLGCAEGDTVTVTRAEAGKYLAVQQTMDMVYSNDRADYPDDAVFANFRELKGGRLKEKAFYRGATPVDDEYHRAGTADRLIRAAGIRFDLDLSDTEEEVAEYAETSKPEYFLSLAEAGNVACLNLGMSYRKAEFYTPLAAGLREMMNHNGPCYIHCVEGKDRTGIVCILLEALAGAGGEEIAADYMETYRNYYGITPGTEQYDAVLNTRFYDMYDWLCSLGGGTPEDGAKAYLALAGMTEEETERLIRYVTAAE